MPRIMGVDIPARKRVDIALTYIHGIGRASAKKVVKEADIDPATHADKLTEDQISRIINVIDRSCTVEGELRRMVTQNVARLKEIKCYRGTRHLKGLPVHGQRTRTNARTRKGPKKTVAGKKSVKALG